MNSRNRTLDFQSGKRRFATDVSIEPPPAPMGELFQVKFVQFPSDCFKLCFHDGKDVKAAQKVVRVSAFVGAKGRSVENSPVGTVKLVSIV